MFNYLSRIKELFFKKKNKNHEDLQLHSLSPINNIEEADSKYKTYNDVFDFILKDESIHNIAVTGQYGAGKSTVIDSYFKDIPPKDYFKISLATFSANNTEHTENNIKLIEKGILQQMFYRKAAKSFPFSRFKRIRPYNPISIALLEICFICSISFFCIIINPDWLVQLYENIIIKENDTKNLNLVFFIPFFISILGFLFLGFHVTKFLLKFRLTKFTFQKMEFGLDDVKDESLLNKYVDEILYFFETTKYKIVIFEDLDRFKNTEIFYHLRELNSLINNYQKIKHRVVFIYALRDEVFEDKSDHTKFFDFIIPIVPVMDAHNSKAVLLSEPILSNIDKEFLKEISLYMDDRRLLTNCINEFKIYDKIIGSSNKKILFALIVYKNFYPKYFATLDKRLADIKSGFIEIDNIENSLENFLIPNVINVSTIKNIYRFLYWNEDNEDNEFIELVETKQLPNFTKRIVDIENVYAKLRDNKSWWVDVDNYAILNNNLLDYLLENKDADFEDDLWKFIDTMFKYDHDQNNRSFKFFTQYQNVEELPYFYKNINKYIVKSNADYYVFFENNHQKLLLFFLMVEDIDNNKFIDFFRHEITFVNQISDITLRKFIKIKKENKVFQDLILKYLDYFQNNISFNISSCNEVSSFFDKNDSDLFDFLVNCFEYLSSL